MQLSLDLLITTPAIPPAVMAAPTVSPDYLVNTHDIWAQFSGPNVMVWTTEKTEKWYLEPGEYGFWDKILDCGKSYMVGDSWCMSAYLRKYSSALSGWQKLAYQLVLQNPNLILHIETKTHEWRVYQRGEYVEFTLPHQDKGGERSYVSRNGKTKILVNED